MKRIALIAALAVIALTGCSAPGTPEEPVIAEGDGGGWNKWVRMEDGRLVYCYFYDRGVSCDWESAR